MHMRRAAPFLLAALLLSLVANALLVRKWWNARAKQHTSATSRMDRTSAKAELYGTLPIDTADIVLFGDSHVELFPMELAGHCAVRNRGLSGETTADLLQRIGPILEARPRRVVIIAGVNDIFRKRSTEATEEDLQAILQALSEHGIEAVLTTIPPNSDGAAQREIDARNAMLRPLCARHGSTLVDLDPVLKKGGLLNPELTFDGLHLNAAGYHRLAGALAPQMR